MLIQKKGKEVYTKVKAYNQSVKEDINFIRSTLGKMNNLFTGIVPQVSKACDDWKKKSAGRLSQMSVKYNEAVGQYKKESALRKKNTLIKFKNLKVIFEFTVVFDR